MVENWRGIKVMLSEMNAKRQMTRENAGRRLPFLPDMNTKILRFLLSALALLQSASMASPRQKAATSATAAKPGSRPRLSDREPSLFGGRLTQNPTLTGFNSTSA